MRIVPFENRFIFVKRLQRFGTILLWISAAIALFGFFLGDFTSSNNIKYLKAISEKSLAALSVIYGVLDIIQSFLFHQAQFERKKDLIDNSFATNLSDENSSGYYSNDNVSPGVLKLGINCFENSFFTSKLTGKMILGESIKLGVIFIVYMLLFLGADQEFNLVVLQIVLPFTFLVQFIKLLLLHYQSKQVFETFKTLYDPVVINREARIIDNVIKYEKLLSWAISPVSTSLFKKHNASLSLEWETQKSRYIDPALL